MTKERLLNFLKEKEFFDKMINDQINEFKYAWCDEFEFIDDQIHDLSDLDWKEEITNFLLHENRIHAATDSGRELFF